ncbi:MAG: M28 family peptidase [Bacteroidales bacterium]|nr:M28 family peptidase [Bacteroidales bacterium]
MRFASKIGLLLALLLPAALPLRAQSTFVTSKDAESAISAESLERDVAFLADSLCGGRATATRGQVEASAYIARRFRSLGLLPLTEGYFSSFVAEGKYGRNIIGLLPSSDRPASDRYIIITAHYDNLGTLGDRLYPGADSNASGVAAMLGIATMFRAMRDAGRTYNRHILFVALDAKQLSMAGANALWAQIAAGSLRDPRTGRPITRRDVSLLVNLDILGSTLSPIHDGRGDYLLSLGNRHADLLTRTNRNYNLYLDLGFDYYGSAGFTDMFLRKVSDQRIFLENGLYSVMFTSGITLSTNREADRADTLDYGILLKRTWLIFHWTERVIQIL